MKKITKEHPITFFRKATEARNKTFKTALKKAQDGISVGPYEKGTSEYLDARYPGTAMKFKGPVDPTYEADQRDKVANTNSFGYGNPSDLEKFDREQEEKGMRSPNMRSSFNSGMGLSKSDAYKKGGSVKKPMMKKGGSVKKMQDGGTGMGKLEQKVRKAAGYTVSDNSSGPMTSTVAQKTKKNGTKKFVEVTNIPGGPSSRQTSKTNKSKGIDNYKYVQKDKTGKVIDRTVDNIKKGEETPKKGIYFSKGGVVKKSGAVKNAKLAALAAPKNKITRADIIVGAKRKKK
jgi:hypothetical protein